ncbi:MAG: hypothetical protein HZA04_09625 [Nitrospinae bacterium]|nr:hypothetical protein [Nitrospinota bacterium]
MTTRTAILLLLLFITSPANAEVKEEKASAQTAGIELDVFPYATGGYYGSAWYGEDRLRIRGIIAQVNTPSFLLEKGFKDNRITAYAAVLDYFVDEGFKGWWFGGGAEYWDSSIAHDEERPTARYSNVVATAGCGYVWELSRNLYLNPWVAGHLMVGGERTVTVGTRSYDPPRFVPELSIKVGWKF